MLTQVYVKYCKRATISRVQEKEQQCLPIAGRLSKKLDVRHLPRRLSLEVFAMALVEKLTVGTGWNNKGLPGTAAGGGERIR